MNRGHAQKVQGPLAHAAVVLCGLWPALCGRQFPRKEEDSRQKSFHGFDATCDSPSYDTLLFLHVFLRSIFFHSSVVFSSIRAANDYLRRRRHQDAHAECVKLPVTPTSSPNTTHPARSLLEPLAPEARTATLPLALVGDPVEIRQAREKADKHPARLSLSAELRRPKDYEQASPFTISSFVRQQRVLKDVQPLQEA